MGIIFGSSIESTDTSRSLADTVIEKIGDYGALGSHRAHPSVGWALTSLLESLSEGQGVISC